MKQIGMDGNKKTGKILFEAGILIMIFNLVSACGIWQSILNSWRLTNGGKLCIQAFIQSGGKYVITYLNQESLYISFLSVLFSFLGNKEEAVSIINLILQISGIVFFYLGAKKLFRFIFSLVLAIIAGLLSVCFYPVITDNSMHIIWCLCGLFFWLGSIVFSDISLKLLKKILLGILLGIFCYVDLIGVFLLTTFVLYLFITQEFNLKTKIGQLIYFLLSAVNGFFVMFYLWNNFLFNKTVFQYWINDKTKLFVEEAGLIQYISLGLILAVSIVFFAIKCSRKSVPASVVLENTVIQESIIEASESTTSIVKTDKIQDTVIEISEVQKSAVEISNLHDIPAEANEVQESAVEISNLHDTPAEANESQESTIETNEIQESIVEEKRKPIKFIENPLPLPKKHVKKEMNYAFEPSKDQMHYDLNNYRLDDDYDLKDI